MYIESIILDFRELVVVYKVNNFKLVLYNLKILIFLVMLDSEG